MGKLLQQVAEGGVRTRAGPARELGVSEGLVEQMLEDLARMGYLKPVEGRCTSQCTGCPLASTCAADTPTRVWTLAEKGQKAAESKCTSAGGRLDAS